MRYRLPVQAHWRPRAGQPPRSRKRRRSLCLAPRLRPHLGRCDRWAGRDRPDRHWPLPVGGHPAAGALPRPRRVARNRGSDRLRSGRFGYRMHILLCDVQHGPRAGGRFSLGHATPRLGRPGVGCLKRGQDPPIGRGPPASASPPVQRASGDSRPYKRLAQWVLSSDGGLRCSGCGSHWATRTR